MDGTGLDSSQNASTSFIRVVSLSIALYESGPSSPITRPPALTSCSPSYILTLPAEWRFYRSQRSWRLSLGCLLFIAIRFAGLLPRSRAHSSLIGAPPPAHRYSSIAVITLSNVGYFGNFFTPASCARYFIIPPIFKGTPPATPRLCMRPRAMLHACRPLSPSDLYTDARHSRPDDGLPINLGHQVRPTIHVLAPADLMPTTTPGPSIYRAAQNTLPGS